MKRCPKCGRTYKDREEDCYHCRIPLVSIGGGEASDNLVQVDESTVMHEMTKSSFPMDEGKMKKCPKCNKIYELETKTCVRCKEALIETKHNVSTVECRKCGYIFEEDSDTHADWVKLKDTSICPTCKTNLRHANRLQCSEEWLEHMDKSSRDFRLALSDLGGKGLTDKDKQAFNKACQMLSRARVISRVLWLVIIVIAIFTRGLGLLLIPIPIIFVNRTYKKIESETGFTYNGLVLHADRHNEKLKYSRLANELKRRQ